MADEGPTSFYGDTKPPIESVPNADEKTETSNDDKHAEFTNEKKIDGAIDGNEEPITYDGEVPRYESEEEDLVIETAEDITTHVLHLEDDKTLNPWTFRMFFLGK